jgi:hypothetical protein
MDLWPWLARAAVTAAGDDDVASVAPGKRTVTERLEPRRRSRGTAVQRRVTAPGVAGGAAALASDDPFFFAEAGVAGPGAPLPFAAELGRAFGGHDLSGVRAHVGGAATAAAGALGARGYALGDAVAFAASPDLHLVAHEVAHVLQQRGGVALAGGLGQADDPYERHADQIADAVVRGESVEALVAAGPRGASAAGPALQRQQHPGGSTTSATTVSAAGSPAAQLAARLRALPGPADEPTARRFLDDLRALAPVTAPTDAAALRAAVDARLTGDARWRATQLIQHGPEAQWPPHLRRNNVAIADAARVAARDGRPPAEVADLLRPLNPTAQRQILRSWGSEGGAWRLPRPNDPATGQPMTLGRYLEEIRAALTGPSFAPAEAAHAAPILDLDLRIPPIGGTPAHPDQEVAVYEYFRALYAARGFEFVETPANAASPTLNVCNVRRFDLTSSATAPTGGRRTVREMNGQLFRIWRDGDGTRHVRRYEWSTTGPGRQKQDDVRDHRDRLLRSAGQATEVGNHRGVAATTQTGAADAVAEAEAAAQVATTEAEAAARSSETRGGAAATLAQAETAMASARRAFRLAELAPTVGVRRNARGRVPAPDPEHVRRAAAAREVAADAFARARDAWVIAHYQASSNREDDSFAALRAARATLAGLPSDAPAGERAAAEAAVATAERDYQRARAANNRGANEGNTGAMSETNGVAWLQEGQYRAERRRVGEHWRYAVNGGGSGRRDLSGYAPVDRDYNANGVIDPGEREIPATSIGSGVQIHQGSNPTASIGCQVSPQFDRLDDAVQHSADDSGFAFVLVEAEHMIPWTGPPAPGARGAAEAAVGATRGGAIAPRRRRAPTSADAGPTCEEPPAESSSVHASPGPGAPGEGGAAVAVDREGGGGIDGGGIDGGGIDAS